MSGFSHRSPGAILRIARRAVAQEVLRPEIAGQLQVQGAQSCRVRGVEILAAGGAGQTPQDILVDDSKEAQIQSLGQALKELEVNGNYFGEFSLTVVAYDLDLSKVEAGCEPCMKDAPWQAGATGRWRGVGNSLRT